MNVGTKSLLFGVHQMVWHPITVVLAWRRLYHQWPTREELACIIVHDWGYWGSPNMDGTEGELHCSRSADIAGRLGMSWEQRDMIAYHSRHYSRSVGAEPSKLCWADKLSILYEPAWWYLLRAWLSGELHEYRQLAHDFYLHSGGKDGVPYSSGPWKWFAWVKARLVRIGQAEDGNCVPYFNVSVRGQEVQGE